MERLTDTYRTDYPVCPFCGFIDQDWWDCIDVANALKKDGDFTHTTCTNCFKDITITINVEYTFSTEAKEA
jgi:hypothetical protein